jgi:hypothetical protein
MSFSRDIQTSRDTEKIMNIRQAILKAADSIEQNPDLFDFNSINLPNHECGTPGCALGWIASFLGTEYQLRRIFNMPVMQKIMDCSDGAFYRRMRHLPIGYEWKYNHMLCAESLRQYADKYHPDHIPESIRKIFEPSDRCVTEQ